MENISQNPISLYFEIYYIIYKFQWVSKQFKIKEMNALTHSSQATQQRIEWNSAAFQPQTYQQPAFLNHQPFQVYQQ